MVQIKKEKNLVGSSKEKEKYMEHLSRFGVEPTPNNEGNAAVANLGRIMYTEQEDIDLWGYIFKNTKENYSWSSQKKTLQSKEGLTD